MVGRRLHGACALALAVSGATVACGDSGSVTLRFDVPDDPVLQPTGAETLTLVARVGDEPPRATTSPIGDGTAIDLGDLPVDDDIWLSAELRSSEEQLVGYGRAAAPLQVDAEADVEATIPVRRPFVYLAGAGSLVSLDTTEASTSTFQGQVSAAAQPTVIADLAGVELAAVSGSGDLTYVATGTHLASDRAGLQLSQAPLDAVATPDGGYLIVGHGGTSPVVSVIEVASGNVQTVPVTVPAERVAVTRGSDGAWWGTALLGRATDDEDCTASRLVRFPLLDPGAATVIEVGGVSDLGADPARGLVLLAQRCAGRIVRFDPVAGAIDEQGGVVMELPSPTAVAALDGKAWAIGHAIERRTPSTELPDGIVDAWLVLGSAPIDAVDGEGASVDALPPLVERIVATRADFPDQDITQDLHANAVEATDLVILPGGEQLALRMTALLHGDALEDPFFGVFLPSLDVDTDEYWLINAASRVIDQRVRTECTISITQPCDGDGLLCAWRCLPDIPAAATGAFRTTAITALFGAR